MTLSRPYLLRAIYDWLIDNSLTPYLLVDAKNQEAVLPLEHVQDGKIILNISPIAIEALRLDNDSVSFSARFSGKAMDLYIPIQAVMALYSMENGKGMMFPDEGDDAVVDNSDDYSYSETATSSSNTEFSDSMPEPKEKTAKKKERPSFIKVVK
ncbi:MAG: ClpXP protease specificity-enhancing factor [Gammaproteobacteria bacterium]|nr:ClpXP protease specificity-enhancing factor [Gammaproteobacteria bacterium]